MLRVRWFYRPEDARGGRRRADGARELFFSDATGNGLSRIGDLPGVV